MAIGIIPHELRKTKNLADLKVIDLDWPNQAIPDVESLSELSQEDIVVTYPSSSMFFTNYKKLPFQVCLILAEPHAIHGKYYKLLGLLRHRFYKVLCRYNKYANKYDNVIALPIVESWVTQEQAEQNKQKTKTCSLIASAKQDLEGHKLRHEIAKWCQVEAPYVDLLGRAYQPFEDKMEGLAPYHYSIVIENNQEQDYFSEKLLDALLCDTIPIYWGCPNIGDYFDTKGMIVCTTEAHLKKAIATCHNQPEETVLAALRNNKLVALKLSRLNARIADSLRT